jgi:aryl-alcohol dehydrogenase-like predicted oxidoreductase
MHFIGPKGLRLFGRPITVQILRPDKAGTQNDAWRERTADSSLTLRMAAGRNERQILRPDRVGTQDDKAWGGRRWGHRRYGKTPHPFPICGTPSPLREGWCFAQRVPTLLVPHTSRFLRRVRVGERPSPVLYRRSAAALTQEGSGDPWVKKGQRSRFAGPPLQKAGRRMLGGLEGGGVWDFSKWRDKSRQAQGMMAVMAETQTAGFGRVRLGRTGLEVGRLGVASGYGVPGTALEHAFECGVDYIFWGSRRSDSFGAALKRLRSQRQRFVLVVQSYTRVASLMSGSLERALRRLSFDYTDVLLLGMWNKPVPGRILDAARKLQQRGLARFLAVSTHKRAMVPRFATGRDFDVIHFRYNAAHPGAERDIFPHLPADRPGMVSFTATSWRQLMGKAPLQGILPSTHRLPTSERVPTAADCYRYVLARPEVDVCLTGPANEEQMEKALEALRLGPMSEEELAWMRRVGRAVAGK